MFGNFCVAFAQFLENLWKVVRNLQKIIKNIVISICLYNKQKHAWLLVDIPCISTSTHGCIILYIFKKVT